MTWTPERERALAIRYPDAVKEIQRLRVELEVRTHNPGFPSRPEQFRKSGASSAFDSGYEAGWKGHAFKAVYTRSDCAQSHLAGYEQGSREASEEIARMLHAAKEPAK